MPRRVLRDSWRRLAVRLRSEHSGIDVLRRLVPRVSLVLRIHICAIVLVLNFPLAKASPRSRVSREAIEARLKRYGGNNAQREATLKQMFSKAGCGGNLSEEPLPTSNIPNVICSLPSNFEEIIIVGAHFDRVSQGDGVVDNWSGASLLPSLYEAMKAKARRHRFIFVAFTDEEPGEVGSRFYAQHMTEQQVSATDAMVNLDSLGLAPTKVLVGHSDVKLSDMIAVVARRLNLPLSWADLEHVGTDADQFYVRKIPCITIHSVTQELCRCSTHPGTIYQRCT